MAELSQGAAAQQNLSHLIAIKRLQWFTVAWMSAEVVIALFAAVRAHSVALAAFGGDSAIELISAGTVLWRFGKASEISEAKARKITGWLLIALAIYICVHSLVSLVAANLRPEPSYLGMALLTAAAIVMPWLAHRKRALAAAANSAALRADSAQSSICGYMAWIALVGLLLNAFVHWPWADPAAALGLAPIVLKEAVEALQSSSG